MAQVISGLLLTTCALLIVQASARFNPYSYFYQPSRADSYSSMGDIDWSKRAPVNDDFEDGEPSMAALVQSQPKRTGGTYQSYKYRQPYSRPYLPYRPSKPVLSVARPQRSYQFHSMADADWGWKKRSQIPAWIDLLNDEELEELLNNYEGEEPEDQEVDKRHYGSLIQKKNVASLARSNLYPLKRKISHGKRSFDDQEDDDATLEEVKRNLASIVAQRHGRSGISSLARNGGVRRPKITS